MRSSNHGASVIIGTDANGKRRQTTVGPGLHGGQLRGASTLTRLELQASGECTGTCPLTTANLVKVQEAFGARLGRDVVFISISLTPDRDTPARLKAYAAEQGCRDGWYFLTGQMADVDRVRRKLGVYDNSDIRQHIGLLTYGNEPAGKWGATNTLGTSDHIIWAVKNRIDGWQAEPWPPMPVTTSA